MIQPVQDSMEKKYGLRDRSQGERLLQEWHGGIVEELELQS